MKWLSKLFKGGSNRPRSGRHHVHDPDEESISWRAPSRASVNNITQFQFSSMIFILQFAQYIT